MQHTSQQRQVREDDGNGGDSLESELHFLEVDPSTDHSTARESFVCCTDNPQHMPIRVTSHSLFNSACSMTAVQPNGLEQLLFLVAASSTAFPDL